MSNIVISPCTGYTKKGTRCRRKTQKGTLCFQHLKSVKHLKITKSGIKDAKLGLFATDKFKKGQQIDQYKGNMIN